MMIYILFTKPVDKYFAHNKIMPLLFHPDKDNTDCVTYITKEMLHSQTMPKNLHVRDISPPHEL